MSSLSIIRISLTSDLPSETYLNSILCTDLIEGTKHLTYAALVTSIIHIFFNLTSKFY